MFQPENRFARLRQTIEPAELALFKNSDLPAHRFESEPRLSDIALKAEANGVAARLRGAKSNLPLVVLRPSPHIAEGL